MAAVKENIIVAFTIDYETGGLKCQTSACTQIAVHATRLDTFEKLGSYVSYISPYTRQDKSKKKTLKSKFDEGEIMMDYEDKALEYSAITMDMLETKGKDIDIVAAEVLEFMQTNSFKVSNNMKPFLIGQNIEFDKGFFMQMAEHAGLVKEFKKVLRGHEDFYGNWQPMVLDTIILGQLAMCHQPTVTSYKLELMCENLGIELNDAHDADADVAATTNVAAVLTQRMRSTGGEVEELNISKTEKTRKYFKI